MGGDWPVLVFGFALGFAVSFIPMCAARDYDKFNHELTIASIANGDKKAVRVDLPDGTVRYFVVAVEKKEEETKP